MQQTNNLLFNKLLKILSLLLCIRLCLYIPVPSVDLNIFEEGQNLNPLFSIARNLTGSSFLAIGSLGILPYINSSIIIQLITPIIPEFEKLQKDEGELGRRKLSQYTRYLTFVWAIGLSTFISFGLLKPLIFNWTLVIALKIIIALTTGSMISMWFSELITEQGLGNGSSMVIFINIIGSIPNNLKTALKTITLTNLSQTIGTCCTVFFLYIVITSLIVIFQDAYKKINVISAKQLKLNLTEKNELKNSYIPIKLNQGGIMPLIFSSTIVSFFIYPLQMGLGKYFSNVETLTVVSLTLNFILIMFFSSFYAILILKPEDIAKNLSKMSYTIPGIKPGKSTSTYIERTIKRLAFVGGLFLSILAFLPIILNSIFKITVFKNITSLLILIGVVTDVTTQVRGFLISKNYENFKRL